MRSKEQTPNSDNAVSKQRLPQSTTQSLGTLARQQAHPATLVQRARLDPRSLTPGDVLQLQRTIGNQAVGRLLAGTRDHPVPPIQAGLTIGQPGDKYEQEADRVASQVVKRINAPASAPSTLGRSVQRQEEPEEELQAKPEITALRRQEEPDEELQAKPRISDLQRSPLPPEIQLEALPEEEDLQAKSIRPRREAIAGGEASTDLASAINSVRGSGQPLDAGLQRSTGQAMGADFSGVRVHTDAQADQLNQSIQAKAFTTGQDVFFRQGAYEPGSRGGQELIAHELTHVVQQNGGAVQRSPLPPQQLQQHPSTETLGNGVIQRAIAIEAESRQTWYIHGKKKTTGGFSPIDDTKGALGSKGKVDLTSDSGNLEYVTKPLANEAEVEVAFKQMISTLDALAESSLPVIINQLPVNTVGLDWKTEADYKQYQLIASSKSAGKAKNARFMPQATIDISFSKFDRYIKEYLKNKSSAELMGKHFVATAEYVNKTPPGIFMSLDMLPLHPAAEGFLKMILMALYDAYTFAGTQDPKYAFATMPRNRFSEMYTAADTASNGNLAEVFPTFVEQVAAMRQDEEIKRLFINGYKGDRGKLKGPTVQEWFDSITAPEFMEGEYGEGKPKARKSDLLSPPPGQRTKREGLGAYDLASGGTIPFFELRDFMSSQSTSKSQTLFEIWEAAWKLLQIEKTLRENGNGRRLPESFFLGWQK